MTNPSGPGAQGATNATIIGVDTSAVAVGAGAYAQLTIHSSALNKQENSELEAVLQQLQAKVAAEAPPQLREEALRKTGEIAEALGDDQPDLGRLESVRNWFVKKLPSLAGAVVSVIVHPLVGRLVEAGGDALTSEFRRRFPTD